MLERILFWVVLAWMAAMLVVAFLTVREVWRETSKPDPEGDQPDTAPPVRPKSESVNHRP